MRDGKPGVAIVVGMGGGVGAALAGAVFDLAECQRVEASVPGSNPMIADLVDEAALSSAMKTLVERSGDRLHAVAVCAGISPPGPLELVPIDSVRRAIEVNVLASLVIYQACMPTLRRTQGRFVMISSNAGKVAFPFLGPYVTSKHALEGMADVMRQEASRWGVHVILIEPGGIQTGMIGRTIAAVEAGLASLSPGQRDLYGAQYERLLGIAKAGARDGLAPDFVAMAIIRAIEARTPRPRYVVGADAIATIRMRRRSSDRTMDRMFEQAYSSESGSLAPGDAAP